MTVPPDDPTAVPALVATPGPQPVDTARPAPVRKKPRVGLVTLGAIGLGLGGYLLVEFASSSTCAGKGLCSCSGMSAVTGMAALSLGAVLYGKHRRFVDGGTSVDHHVSRHVFPSSKSE